MVLDLIDHSDMALLGRMLFAHILADFLLQSDHLVRQRVEKGWTSSWLYVHGLLAGLSVYLLAAQWSSVWVFAIVAISHIAIDGVKSAKKRGLGALLVDQGAHLGVIVFSWVLLAGVPSSAVARTLSDWFADPRLWVLVVAYAAAIWPGAVLVGHVAGRWGPDREDRGWAPSKTDESASDDPGMPRAGMLIGRLERILIVTFVLCHQYEAIGFLIAAKSVFRFGRRDGAEARRETEYFLIGTLASFLVAIVLGLAAGAALATLR